MNSTFKVVFNKARGALMVVNEVTSSVQAKGTKTVVATAVAAMIAGVAGVAQAAVVTEPVIDGTTLTVKGDTAATQVAKDPTKIKTGTTSTWNKDSDTIGSTSKVELKNQGALEVIGTNTTIASLKTDNGVITVSGTYQPYVAESGDVDEVAEAVAGGKLTVTNTTTGETYKNLNINLTAVNGYVDPTNPAPDVSNNNTENDPQDAVLEFSSGAVTIEGGKLTAGMIETKKSTTAGATDRDYKKGVSQLTTNGALTLGKAGVPATEFASAVAGTGFDIEVAAKSKLEVKATGDVKYIMGEITNDGELKITATKGDLAIAKDVAIVNKKDGVLTFEATKNTDDTKGNVTIGADIDGNAGTINVNADSTSGAATINGDVTANTGTINVAGNTVVLNGTIDGTQGSFAATGTTSTTVKNVITAGSMIIGTAAVGDNTKYNVALKGGVALGKNAENETAGKIVADSLNIRQNLTTTAIEGDDAKHFVNVIEAGNLKIGGSATVSLGKFSNVQVSNDLTVDGIGSFTGTDSDIDDVIGSTVNVEGAIKNVAGASGTLTVGENVALTAGTITVSAKPTVTDGNTTTSGSAGALTINGDGSVTVGDVTVEGVGKDFTSTLTSNVAKLTTGALNVADYGEFKGTVNTAEITVTKDLTIAQNGKVNQAGKVTVKGALVNNVAPVKTGDTITDAATQTFGKLTLENGGSNAGVIAVSDKFELKGGTFTSALKGSDTTVEHKGITAANGFTISGGTFEVEALNKEVSAAVPAEGTTPAKPAVYGLELVQNWTLSGGALTVKDVDLSKTQVFVADGKTLAVNNGSALDLGKLTLEADSNVTKLTVGAERTAESTVTIGELVAKSEKAEIKVDKNGVLNVGKLVNDGTTDGKVTVAADGELNLTETLTLKGATNTALGYLTKGGTADAPSYTVQDFGGITKNDGFVTVKVDTYGTGADAVKLGLKDNFGEATAYGIVAGSALDAISKAFVKSGDTGLVFVDGIAIDRGQVTTITQADQQKIQNLVIAGLDSFNVTGVTEAMMGSVGTVELGQDAHGNNLNHMTASGDLIFNGEGQLIKVKPATSGAASETAGLALGNHDLLINASGEAEIGAIIGTVDSNGNYDGAVIASSGDLTVKGNVKVEDFAIGFDKDGNETEGVKVAVEGDLVASGVGKDSGIVVNGELTVGGDLTDHGEQTDVLAGSTVTVGGDVTANVINAAGTVNVTGDTTAEAIVVGGEANLADVALVDGVEVAVGGKLTAGDIAVSGVYRALDEEGNVLVNELGVAFPDISVEAWAEMTDAARTAAELAGYAFDAGAVVANGELSANSITVDGAVAANGTTVTVTEGIVADTVEGLNATIEAGAVEADTAILTNGSLTAGTVDVTSLNAANATTKVEELTAETAVIAGGSLEAGEVTVGQATLVGTTATIGTLTGNVNVGRDDFKANLYVTNFADGTIFSDPAFGESGKMTFAEANNVAIGTVGGDGFAHLARGTVAVIGQDTMEGVGEKLASVGITELEQNKVDSALVVIGGKTNTGSVRLDNATAVGSSTGALVTSATTALVIDGASFAEAPALFEEGNIELNGVTYITDAKAGTTIQLTGNGQILGNGVINTDVNRVFNADKEGGSLVVNVKEDMGVLEDLVAIDAVKSYYGEAYGNGGNAAFIEGMLGNANTMKDRDIVQAMNDVAGIGASAGMASVTMDALSAFNDIVANRTSILAPAAEATTLWVDVNAGRYEAKRLFNGAGYSSDIYAGAFGVDTVVACGAKIGAAFTFGSGDTDSKNTTAQTSMDSDFIGFSLYTSKTFADVANVAIDLGYMKGSNDVSVKAYGLDKFSADSDAITFGVRGELLAKVGAFDLVPHAGLRWTKLSVDSFEAGYKTDIDDMNVFQLPIGITVAGSFEGAGFTWAPAFDLSFVPAFGDKDADMTLGIAGASQTSAYGVQVIDSNPVQATIGLDATNGAWAFGLNYKLGAGSDGRMNNSFNANVRYAF